MTIRLPRGDAKQLMKYRHLELGVIHMQAGFKPGAGLLNHDLERAKLGDSAPLTKQTRPKVRGPKGGQGEATRKERKWRTWALDQQDRSVETDGPGRQALLSEAVTPALLGDAALLFAG